MADTISRQAAIEIIQSMYPGMPRIPWMRKDWQKRYEPYIRTENAIRELPSAQPEMDEWCEDCKEYDSEKHCCPRWNRVIMDTVKEIKQQQWIPCNERLPEYDGEMYLVTDYCEQINRRRIHISYCYVNREGFWSDVPFGYKVIAWMPLPEPYEENSDG